MPESPSPSLWSCRRREGGKMNESAFIFRMDYPSDYKYRKAIKEYRDLGYIIAKCSGGVIAFRHESDYDTWKNQK